MVMIERMPSSAFAPKSGLGYVDVFELHKLFDGLAYRAPTVLVGPKGVGKTLSVQAWAATNKVPVITFDCSEDVRRPHLLGMPMLRGDESPFVLGPLTTAYEVANEMGHCVIALEEINALTPQMQKALNAVADWRSELVVPECGKVFKLEGGAKLWLVGTMNTSVYGGVYELNEDLKSRFRMISLGYPKPGQELKIVKQQLSPDIPKQVIQRVLQLANETRQTATEYALSTRDVVQVLEDVMHMGLPSALRLVLGKFEGADRATMEKRVRAVFGADELEGLL